MTTTTEISLYERYGELYERKRELEATLKAISDELAGLEPVVQDKMLQDGITSAKLQSGMLLYQQRMLWARAKDGDRAATAAGLKRIGLADFVHEDFNVNSLSAYVRELDKTGESRPDGFDEIVQVDEEYRIRARQG